MSGFSESYTIGKRGTLEKMSAAEFDGDPRGILWIWRPPQPNRRYVMGIDPSVGRTGWNRFDRVKEDARTDNGAIEIVEIGKGLDGHGDFRPDEQVAEFAAPVDAFELGYIANCIGRLYGGVDEGQCKAIVEVHPGPGTMTYRQMIELGYTNHFVWEHYADTVPTPTRQLGWVATPTTNRDLWLKSSRHIMTRKVLVRSPWLQEEYVDCRMNVQKQYAENPGGHDDRVRAFNLGLWVANRWSLSIERMEEEIITEKKEPVEWAASDMTFDQIEDAWAETMQRMYSER